MEQEFSPSKDGPFLKVFPGFFHKRPCTTSDPEVLWLDHTDPISPHVWRMALKRRIFITPIIARQNGGFFQLQNHLLIVTVMVV